MEFIDSDNLEVLECARYGEPDDLRQLLASGANVNYKDASGSTALHKAAANNEVDCLQVLYEFHAEYMINAEGNTPAHWAAQNGKLEALKYLIDHYNVNVLAQNSIGRSILTEAFQSGNTDCIEICLSHDSASEDKLIDISNNNKSSVNVGVVNVDSNNSNHSSSHDSSNGDNRNNINSFHDDSNMDCTSSAVVTTSTSTLLMEEENHAVIHTMLFDGNILVRIRELPITNPDNPFGSDIRPEDDTTGLSLWPASIILAHWVAKIGRLLLLSRHNNNESSLKNESSSNESSLKNESSSNEFSSLLNESLFRRPRVVLELGAGCGLPGIVAGIGLRPDVVYITDIHEPTLKNAEYNVQLNNNEEEGGALECGGCVDVNNHHDNDHDDDNDSGRIMEKQRDTDAIMSDDNCDRNTTTTSNNNNNNDNNTTITKVIRMDWTTIASYPCEKVDLLLGSDLVYDINILSILVPTICYLLHADGSFLYVAPDTGRQGMEQFEFALKQVNIVCIERSPASDDMYRNLLQHTNDNDDDDNDDLFILHFYDLSAKMPHTLYHFQWSR